MTAPPWDAEELELETKGRRSGKPHRVRAWFAYEDGVLWLRTDGDTDWLRNLRRDPACVVRIAGRAFNARYEPAPATDEARRHLVALWRAKYGADQVQDWYVERGREPVTLRLER